MKALLTIVSIGVWLTVCGPVARAGAPMGPAMATLEKGQWWFGLEYAHENINLEADGSCVESVMGGGSESYPQSFKIDDLESNMFFGRLTYGLCDTWDVFVRVGVADAQDNLKVNGPGILSGVARDGIGFDGSYGFAWGIGTRATFWRSGPWSVSGLAQVTWLDPDDSRFQLTVPEAPNQAVAGDGKLDYLQTQFNLAAIYQKDGWGLWAGPFLQLVDGDLDLDAQFVIDGETLGQITCSGDMEEESLIGLHAGAAYAMTNSLACWVEGQFTGDSWLLGIGAVIRPEKAFAGE